MSLENAEVIGTLASAWKRQLVSHAREANGVEMFAVYANEALTGWVGLIMKPWIGKYENKPCLLMPLASWMHLKAHSVETVTPFRIVLKGKGIISKGWKPISGLKYAVRNTEYGACLHIPLTEFRPLGNTNEPPRS